MAQDPLILTAEEVGKAKTRVDLLEKAVFPAAADDPILLLADQVGGLGALLRDARKGLEDQLRVISEVKLPKTEEAAERAKLALASCEKELLGVLRRVSDFSEEVNGYRKSVDACALETNETAVALRQEASELGARVNTQLGEISSLLRDSTASFNAFAADCAAAKSIAQAANSANAATLANIEEHRATLTREVDRLRAAFAEAPRAFNPRGLWKPGVAYMRMDFVGWLGGSFLSLVDDNTEKPNTDGKKWMVIALRGAPGMDGAPGSSTTGTGGTGTVTNTGALTSNAVVLGNGGVDTKVVAGITTDGTSKITLGVAGTSVGSVDFKNATSGTITLQPVTGALGAITLSLPATTSTLAGLAIAQTFSAIQTFTPQVVLTGGASFPGGGTITGASGAITLTAGGTAQSINLTPSTTGSVIIPGNVNAPSIRAGVMEIQSFGLNNTAFADNIYFDGTNNKYRATGFGSYIQFNGGEILFRTAPSGTAAANATVTTWLKLGNTGQFQALATTAATTTGTGCAIFAGGIGVAGATYTATLNVNSFAVTVNGAATLNDWFDQSVKTTASPTFAAAALSQASNNAVVLTVGNATNNNIIETFGGNSNANPAYRQNIYRSRAGGVITTGDNVFSFYSYAHDGTGYTEVGTMRFNTEGTIATNRTPGVFLLQLHPDSTSADRTVFQINSAGTVQFSTYGAGTLTTDSSGNITATSDLRAKNIIAPFTTGLAAIRQLTPQRYNWKKETGLNTQDLNVSLIAQDLIAAGIPEAVFTQRTVAVTDDFDDGSGKIQKRERKDAQGDVVTQRVDAVYSVNDRAVIAVLVNAIKELALRVDALDGNKG